jgi:hypothetical protein
MKASVSESLPELATGTSVIRCWAIVFPLPSLGFMDI